MESFSYTNSILFQPLKHDCSGKPAYFSSNQRFVGVKFQDLNFQRAGSWINGALHAKGRDVSTPVGSTTKRRPFAPNTIPPGMEENQYFSSTAIIRSCFISVNASLGKVFKC